MARHLRNVFAGISALALLVYVALAMMRCVHPFLAGQKLYAEPSLEYIAFPYTPLFVWLGALSARLFGPGFLALRLVSLLSSAACLALLYRCGARHGGSRYAGVFALGLYAASYRFCGAWFDVARVDSTFLALVLAALEVLELSPGLTGAWLSGLLFFTAFGAKQTALVPAAFVGLALFGLERRAGLVFALALGLPLAASTLYADALSDGWYRWYVFDLLRGHAWDARQEWGFWLKDIVVFAPAVGLTLLAWLHAPRPARPEDLRAGILPFALAGLVLAAWISRAHVGGYDNTLMPSRSAESWAPARRCSRWHNSGSCTTTRARSCRARTTARRARRSCASCARSRARSGFPTTATWPCVRASRRSRTA